MRDTELYQTLLGLAAPWEVTAVNITKPAADRPLGEIAVAVRWRPEVALVCPSCGQVGPGYDARQRRWRHLNTMQWKTFITAEVPRLNCPKCGVKQVRVAWAEHDRTIPYRRYGHPMRARIPGADFIKLPGVGHVPMSDDPELVARSILEVTSAADEAAARRLGVVYHPNGVIYEKWLPTGVGAGGAGALNHP